MAKIIAVIGATGKQGGSVVSALHGNPDWHVRAITRNPSSPKAKDLEATGIEVVQADLDDTQSLVKAFEGASHIFAVTDFWEPYQKAGPLVAMRSEFTHGQNAATAAARTPTLQHFIWSTLPDALRLSEGRFHVPHFQAKSQVDTFIRGNQHLRDKTTFLLVGYYADNFRYPVFAVNKIESAGKYVQLLPVGPDTHVALAGDVDTNTGLFVRSILEQPSLTLSRRVIQVTDVLSKGDMLRAWGRATGHDGQVELLKIPIEDYERLYPGWGFEMGNMLKYFDWMGEWKRSWDVDDNVVTAKALGIEDRVVGFEEGLKKWCSDLKECPR